MATPRIRTTLVTAALLLAATGSHAQTPATPWKKRVSRIIDMQPPEDTATHRLRPEGNDSTLLQMLITPLEAGKFTAFNNYDALFTQKMSRSDIRSLIASRTDTILVLNPLTGVEEKRYRRFDFLVDLIHKYRVVEDWAFDPATGTTDIQIVGLGPIKDIYGDDGTFRGHQTMFWVTYKDARPVLTRYEQLHPDNSFSLKIWNDYFQSTEKPKEEK
ncbi:MAG: hypothetical protein V4649_02560 [Bacteroidota bacterium]